jgi:hypothetical protein
MQALLKAAPSPLTLHIATPEGQLSGARAEACTTAVPLLLGIEACTAARMEAEAFTRVAADITDAVARMRAEAFTRVAADITDAVARMQAEAFTRVAAGIMVTAAFMGAEAFTRAADIRLAADSVAKP